MVMASVSPPEAVIIGKFDIKGSVQGRQTSIRQKVTSITDLDACEVYKDKDFDAVVGQIILPQANAIKDQIEKDS